MDALSTPAVTQLGLDVPIEALAGAARSRDPATVERVAKEFESLFMSLVLKEMRQTLEPGSFFAGDSSDLYGGLFDLLLGKHLVQAGGFGVAKMLKQYLHATETP